MIFLISPAKTFSKTIIQTDRKPYFEKDASFLISKLKKLSTHDLQEKMKISKKLADEVSQYFKQFGKIETKAIHTYDGYQYKAINPSLLSDASLSYMDNHVYIISGLYGIVKPNDGISYYRLEMKDQSIKDLYAFWNPKFKNYLETFHQHDMIIDLMSTEYRKAFKGIDRIQIDFYERKDNDLKSISMHVKKMRGLFLKHVIENRIENVMDLKKIVIDSYHFSEELSLQRHFIFIKEV